mmetsp:Transcript_9249/g.28143  ORF Transcript_9249/g.28143 Transcript_9249/m.28143 type:complete len:243 (-) Transcript_9249:719-1447(-)
MYHPSMVSRPMGYDSGRVGALAMATSTIVSVPPSDSRKMPSRSLMSTTAGASLPRGLGLAPSGRERIVRLTSTSMGSSSASSAIRYVESRSSSTASRMGAPIDASTSWLCRAARRCVTEDPRGNTKLSQTLRTSGVLQPAGGAAETFCQSVGPERALCTRSVPSLATMALPGRRPPSHTRLCSSVYCAQSGTCNTTSVSSNASSSCDFTSTVSSSSLDASRNATPDSVKFVSRRSHARGTVK